MHRFAEIAFTPAVQALQERDGSRAQYAKWQTEAGPNAALGEREAGFLAQTDGFFLATVSETGWPYVQHRGGPPGFLKVLAPALLGFPDFRGNRQFVSAGNVARDDRAAMIVVDHAKRQRLKLLGRLHFRSVGEADPALVRTLSALDSPGRVERIATFAVEAFDWNCPQHIAQRFTLEQVDAAAQPLRARITELEAEVQSLEKQLASTQRPGPNP